MHKDFDCPNCGLHTTLCGCVINRTAMPCPACGKLAIFLAMWVSGEKNEK